MTTAGWKLMSPRTTRRRNARDPVAAGSLKNNDVYPPRDGVGWSENAARQLSVPERFGFSTWLKTKGFRSCLMMPHCLRERRPCAPNMRPA